MTTLIMERCENPHHKRYSVRQRLIPTTITIISSLYQAINFLRDDRKDSIGLALTKDLFVEVPGVNTVYIHQWDFVIAKGVSFTWDEIDKGVEKIWQRYEKEA